MNDLLKMDKQRYADEKMPMFQYFFRMAQKGGFYKLVFKPLFIIERRKRCIDLAVDAKIGGCYFGHASGITINSHATIGDNVNIHKGVTIGRENRVCNGRLCKSSSFE
jgi:serine O-acetyltransferase